MKRIKNIGVFDSGFGGLNVLSGLVRELPGYNYVYLGDSARVPYGKRTQDEIFRFTKQAVDFLYKRHCDLVILACNSASSGALRRIQQDVLANQPHRRVLGVLIPSAEDAVLASRGRIGVIATEATVRSGAFEREISKLNPDMQVFSAACPLLVPLVEEGLEESRIAKATVVGSLKPIVKQKVDTLVLGCTHYGILEPMIREAMGDHVAIVSQQRSVPPKLTSYLARHADLERRLALNSARTFYTTDKTDRFDRLGSKFFGKVIHARKVTLS